MSSITDILAYEPVKAAVAMHQAPRFGNSNRIADMASENEASREDYIDGMMAFSIFLLVFILVWASILLYLKLRYGVAKVGCAAGGGVVNVTEMHRQNISRHQRKNRILRNWRIQTIFLGASMTLPVLSFLLANRGLDPFMASLSQVNELSNEIDSKAYIGIYTAMRSKELHTELKKLMAVDLLSFCPNYETSAWAADLGLQEIQATMTTGLEQADAFSDGFAESLIDSLYQVTELTASTEETTDWLDRHDWIVRLFLVALNIVNSFFLFAVFLTKNEVDYVALQAMTSWLLLPLFCLVVAGFAGATCAVAIVAMTNADFCTGGEGTGSPLGTLQDIVKGMGYSHESRVYKSLEYYANNCADQIHPVSILTDTQDSLTATADSLRQVFNGFSGVDPLEIEEQCGGDIAWVNETMGDVSETLQALQANIDAALDLTDCPSVTPILEKVTFGSTCAESVEGLTFMFSMTLSITFLCMVMLTTRAALFNPLKRARRKKRREKEFQEYREYMSKFYNTADWTLDPPGLKQILGSPTKSTVNSDSDGSVMSSDFNIEMELAEDEVAIKIDPPSAPYENPEEDGVIYYSSDSDSEDEASIAQSLNSSLSAFVSHIWSQEGSARVSARPSRNLRRYVQADEMDDDDEDDDDEDDDQDDDDDEDGHESVSVEESTNISITPSMVSRFIARMRKHKTPTKPLSVQQRMSCNTLGFQESPYSTNINQQHRVKDPLSLGYCQNSILSDDSSIRDEELFPLSPVKAPRKVLKHIPRTHGARKISLASPKKYNI